MHIAQIAPLTEAIPPKLYGGTERVVSLADRGADRARARGHAVCQRRFGDVGAARSGWPRALRLDGSVRDPERAAHDDAGAGPSACGRVRFSAFPSRLLSVLAVFAPADAVRDHACMAGSICRSISRCSTTFSSVPVVSISNAQRRPLPQADWVRTVHHGLPENLLRAASRSSRPISHFSAASRRKRASIAPSGSRSIAACRSRSPPRSTRSTATISTSRSSR